MDRQRRATLEAEEAELQTALEEWNAKQRPLDVSELRYRSIVETKLARVRLAIAAESEGDEG